MSSPSDSMTDSRKSEIKEQARIVGEDLKKLGGIAKDATRDGLTAAKERAAQTYGQVRDKSGEVGEVLTEHVRQHPWQSVVIAAGVGALLAVLLGRRR